MSIKTQKIIMWVPIINFLLLFVWMNFHIKSGRSFFKLLPKLLLTVAIAFALVYPVGMLLNIIDDFYILGNITLHTCIFFITYYLLIVVICAIAIWDQKKYLEKSKNE